MTRIAFFLLLLILIFSNVAMANCPVTQDTMFGISCSGTDNTLPDDHSGQAKFLQGGKVTHKEKTYQIEPGGSINVDGDTITVTKGKEITTDAGTTMNGVTRAEVSPEEERIEQAEEVTRADIKLKKTTEVVIEADSDFSAAKAETVTVSGITAHNADGISRNDGVLSIKQADRIEIVDGLLGGVEEFSGTGIQFRVEQARDVIIGCVSLRGLEHSDLTISTDAIRINPSEENVDFTISDCNFKQSTFQARSDKSEIIIPRQDNQDYKIKEADLTCHGLNANERVVAHGQSTVTYSEDCFSCVQLGSDSTYWHNSEELATDFGLTVSERQEPYSLCLRKAQSNSYSNYSGLVDFVDSRMEFGGKITYRRMPIYYDQIISLIMDPVYESYDDGNQVVFELDDDFNFINRLTLSNLNPSEGALAFITNGYYAVYERYDGTDVNRFGRFNDEFKAVVIREYGSDFGSSTPMVTFDEDLLVQKGSNDFGTTSKVTAICDNCAAKVTFESDIAQRQKRLSQTAGRCGI